MEYIVEFQGTKYTPEGKADVPGTVEDRNRETERQEIEWLKTAPARVFLYVGHDQVLRSCCRAAGKLNAVRCPVCESVITDSPRGYVITTWLGTVLGTHVAIGQRRIMGFHAMPGRTNNPWFGKSYRRAVSCRLFGVLYHGWYFESSGSYCRLKKATVQP